LVASSAAEPTSTLFIYVRLAVIFSSERERRDITAPTTAGFAAAQALILVTVFSYDVGCTNINIVPPSNLAGSYRPRWRAGHHSKIMPFCHKIRMLISGRIVPYGLNGQNGSEYNLQRPAWSERHVYVELLCGATTGARTSKVLMKRIIKSILVFCKSTSDAFHSLCLSKSYTRPSDIMISLQATRKSESMTELHYTYIAPVRHLGSS
jgi:hypothetical protein